ncbi:tripartite tricarboxylate transporter substrate binding protein [Roseomonas sp. 18066]|uniref:Bug family tripartite tricarboxylate transporter substrate binding protein n=1 Tax=Roseomonas sp. 18066 TaxID=2681412 RepID=UPI00135BD4CA|nr:tripartite tricarboxylate transporter substrate binding protein [Roseomonas sp. 18066]
MQNDPGRRWLLRLAAAALTATAAPRLAGAQAPSSRPIRAIVPFPAGSATDAMARFLGEHSAQKLGQATVVENMAGANGAIGARSAARMPGDGSVLFYATNSTHSANPHLLRDPGYDPIRDFVPVTLIGTSPLILFVSPKFPARTLQEFIAYAKESSGTLNFGTGNTGSLAAAHLLLKLAGIRGEQISYRGTPEAITDLLGGRLQFVVTDLGPTAGHLKTGDLRAIAVTTKTRSQAVPDLPTMQESGLAGMDFASWNGIFAPAGTPDAAVQRLNRALVEAIRSPAGVVFFRNLGIDVVASSPEEMGQFAATELGKWGRILADAGVPRN